MSDSELKAATETYRVLRLRRRDRLEGGAGDVAWVWPIGLGVLVIALAIQRWRRQQRFHERARELVSKLDRWSLARSWEMAHGLRHGRSRR
jgi:hypothetical protein